MHAPDNKLDTVLPLPARLDITGIQVLRFVAAILVVITHSTFYAHERLAPDFPVWRAGAAGVDIFFAISGFVMFYSYLRRLERASATDFFVRRLIRIVPVYWIATFLKILTILLLPAAVLHSGLEDKVYVLKSFFFIPAYNMEGRIEPLLGVGWTLLFEMFFYTVFSVALLLRISPLLFCSVVLVPCALAYPLRDASWPAFALYFSPFSLEFIFGMLVAVLAAQRINPVLAALALVGGLVLLALPTAAHMSLLETIALRAVPAAAIVFGVVGLERALVKPKEHGGKTSAVMKAALFMGAASYSLYLVHPLVSPIAPQLFSILRLDLPVLSVILSVCLAVGCAVVVHVIAERPITDFLNARWKNRKLVRETS